MTLSKSGRNGAGQPPAAQPEPWIYPARGIAIRLFITCWLVYAIHLATNTVREIVPAVAMADHFSFRVDEYANMHPDMFEMKGRGWYANGNPGASMIAAVPYFFCKPVLDRIVDAVNRSRAAQHAEPPVYNSPWPMARAFYREAWRRGLDIKLGLAAAITQALCMAPISAMGVVAMFFLLRALFASDRIAFWLALLYAFGTPVFYRAGILNHNMMAGHFALMGFMAMWNPNGLVRWSDGARYAAGGLAGGLCFLLDNSGAILLGALFCYAVARAWNAGGGMKLRAALMYGAGAMGPVLVLWFYQWQCFGNFYLPVQHWMVLPNLKEVHVGYHGLTLPQAYLVRMLLFDYRFGLFVTCPLLLLALAAPWADRRRVIPGRELAAIAAISVTMVLFFGGWTSTVLQFSYGMRYLAPLVPFLYLCVAAVLVRLPRRFAYLIATVAVGQAWSMAMYRDIERGFGVLDTVLHVAIGGFQLPALTVLSRLGAAGEYAAGGVSPLPIFAMTAAILFVVWSGRTRAARDLPGGRSARGDEERLAVGANR